MPYIIDNLRADHKKSAFSCGHASLDNYIKKQASQDIKRQISAVFVMTEADQDTEIIGYYTLICDNIDHDCVPDDIKKKMPSYDTLPVTLLGRLAVSKDKQRQGIGEKLLLDALKKSFDVSKTMVGSIAVVVDPIDMQARSFYAQYGFILLPDRGRMFLPMNTIKQLF
jgi:predicted GNAT family N-acyltransferase